jgi:hypothetical protein
MPDPPPISSTPIQDVIQPTIPAIILTGPLTAVLHLITVIIRPCALLLPILAVAEEEVVVVALPVVEVFLVQAGNS